MEPGIATIAALVVGGYLLGSVPAAYLIGRVAGANVYEVGTRNPGAANTFREVGRAAGVAVFVADALKGALPVVAGRLLDAPVPVLAAGAAAAVLGQWLPVFMHFRGGAGLATAIGSGAALTPLLAVIAGVVGLVSVVLWRRTVESAVVGYAVLIVAAFLLDTDWQAVAAGFALVVAVGVARPRRRAPVAGQGRRARLRQRVLARAGRGARAQRPRAPRHLSFASPASAPP